MAAAAANDKSPGRLALAYNEVQTSCLHHALPLPSVLCSFFSLVDGPPISATENPNEIAKLFPNQFGQPSAALMLAKETVEGKLLKVRVMLSGGQALGGHNVICGIFDFLQDRAKGSTMYGLREVRQR